MRLLPLLLVAAMGLSACADGGNSTESPTAVPTPERPASAGVAGFEGVGRDATPDEVAAWDIDVRPDFTGLPPGSGDVYTGEELWIGKCTSCHGDFGDANHVFVPLIGNTTTEDIETGRVASLASGGAVRTTFTKVATVSTLWDYIHRAMPWDAPKSLSHDEVYALLAYMLNLAEIVPMDFELSNENIAEVQARMPNRNGMIREHGLWKIDGAPDTDNTDCMSDCTTEVEVLSELPGYARPAHGNLADQNRTWGPIRGAVTLAEGEQPEAPPAAEPEASSSDPANEAVVEMLSGYGCQACHGMDRKIVGPGFNEIAGKYRDEADAVAYLTGKIQQGGSGVWGAIPMPPQPQVSDEDAARLAAWIAEGAQP
jgi:S-disulfanyl-L-cysteine oxidoreductase SoxD